MERKDIVKVKGLKVVSKKRNINWDVELFIRYDKDYKFIDFNSLTHPNDVSVLKYELLQLLKDGYLIKLYLGDNIEVGLDISEMSNMKILYFKVNEVHI